MYPYDRKLQWWVRGRYRHLIDGLAQQKHLLDGPRGGEIQKRISALRRWLTVRLVALVILSFSAASGIATTLITAGNGPSEAEDLLRLLTRIASSLVGLATLLYLLANRTMAQCEIDALLLAQQATAAKRK